MSKKACYKEDSLSDFALWAVQCGHYPVAPLIKNYREYIEDVRNESTEPVITYREHPSEDT